MMKFQPFLVIDRPNLLIPATAINNQISIGLMSHTFVSENFANQWTENNINVRICDSGVFLKSQYRRNLSYGELFNKYEMMKTDYGIIFDCLKDPQKTLVSATEAINLYQSTSFSFKLIGVAQGNTVGEYVACVRELIALGYTHIAIGGLLQKLEQTARFVRVQEESFLESVFAAVREVWSGWLFSLGTYHPKRLPLFEKYKLFGSDSKRWAFRCQPNLSTQERHQQIIDNFLSDYYSGFSSPQQLTLF